MRAILLILFVVVAVGYAAYRLKKLTSPKEETTNPETEAVELPEEETTSSEAELILEEQKRVDDLNQRLEAELRNLELEKERIREEAEERRESREKAERERKEKEANFAVHRFVNREAPSPAELQNLFEEAAFVDLHSNTVVVATDTLDRLGKVTAVLKVLDTKAHRTLYRIEGILVTANLQNSDEFSIDWLIKYEYPNNPLFFGESEAGPGSIRISSEYFDLAVDKARSVGALGILARPNLILGHGETATISSGREVPLPISNTQDGNVQTSVEYRSVALSLEVGLREIAADKLALSIRQVNEQINGQTVIGESEVPELASQQWQTQIQPEFGRWYAIGGVATETREEFRRFGWFFKNRDDRTEERREIGMFVRVVPVEAEWSVPDQVGELGASGVPLFRAEPIIQAVPVNQK